MIATNCEEVRLKLNGKAILVNPPTSYPNKMITGYIPYSPGTLEVKGYINGQEVCTYTLKTAGPAVKLEFDSEMITLEGKEGVSAFRESSKVNFTLTGPAEIISLDNGDLCSNEPIMVTGCTCTGAASVQSFG